MPYFFTLYFKDMILYAQNQACCQEPPLSSREPLPYERREFPDSPEAHALVEIDGFAVGGGHREAHFPAPVLAHAHERAAQKFIAHTRAADLRRYADLRDVARFR